MVKFAQFILAGSFFFWFTLSVEAENQPADPLTQKLLAEYGKTSYRAEWVNPWMPEAHADVVFGPSGDEMLTEIIAQYTRKVLDRGGWENAYLSNSDYSVGNLLLLAKIGEGITVTAGI